MTDPTSYAMAWEQLRRALDELEKAGAHPVILSALPFRTDRHRGHSPFPFVLVPSGRLVPMAVGLRAALPDTMLVLVGAAETVTLGTNHLIHAARRNMGMILLVLRSDLLPGQDDGLDRAGWVETRQADDTARSGTPLEWASALNASFVARANVSDTASLVDLISEAHERNGFSVIGLTADSSLSTGVAATNDWPEFFTAYREWAAPLRKDDGALADSHMSVEPDADSPRRVEVRIAGTGGQGVKLAGTVLSEAAGYGAGLWATHYGEYGSATRGGPSKVDVVYGADRITYAGSDHPDVFVVLSTSALDRNAGSIGANTVLVVDESVDHAPIDALRVPLVSLAREHTGKPIAAGICSLGAVAALAPGLSLSLVTAAVEARLPSRIAGKNTAALVAAHEQTLERMGASV